MKKLRTFEDGLDEVLADIRATLISKQKDYGKDNILDFKEVGILVRANDKMSRLKNLVIGKKRAQNESIEDSWKDLAGYAILALMLRNGTFELPMEEDQYGRIFSGTDFGHRYSRCCSMARRSRGKT